MIELPTLLSHTMPQSPINHNPLMHHGPIPPRSALIHNLKHLVAHAPTYCMKTLKSVLSHHPHPQVVSITYLPPYLISNLLFTLLVLHGRHLMFLLAVPCKTIHLVLLRETARKFCFFVLKAFVLANLDKKRLISNT